MMLNEEELYQLYLRKSDLRAFLKTFTVKELINFCRENHIPYYTFGWKKSDIINAIIHHFAIRKIIVGDDWKD